MTAQLLTSELGSIFQEAKKKNSELRNAVEKSLQDLKVLPATSESQIAADLRRRPQFIAPFLLACRSGNNKLTLPAVTCIQRLIVIGGLPVERLKEILEAFQECCKTGLDVQLRILQSLPQLLQNYSESLQGELQSSLLQVCTTLHQVKTVTISSTASAILQQIVSLLFEKVESEDEREEDPETFTRLDCDGQSVPVAAAAHDAYRVFEDLCLLTDGQKSRFIPNAALSTTFGLELIESVLINHGDLFSTHQELMHLLRAELMPIVTRLFSERLSFSITVRTVRIICILLREHLSTIYVEGEILLGLLNHSLDADNSMPWRRALCMETYRVLYSSANLAVEIYSHFDEKPGRRNVIQENLGTFVKLASEKPALIGLGQQSSFPVGVNTAKAAANQEQAILETGGVAGVITGELGIVEVNAPGISTQWSSMRTPCLDQVDKSEPSAVPDTYAYSLVLTCLNGLSENLAKVVLPLTTHNQTKPEYRRERSMSGPASPTRDSSEDFESEERSQNVSMSPAMSSKRRHRAIPANPLSLDDHPLLSTVQTIAHMIDNCWPAILASSSTFLNAALDAEYYRGLIRSFQRFTQVSGLLRLSTPRDAFLTTLAKAAVPSNLLKIDTTATPISGTASPRTISNSPFASMDNYLTSPTAESPTASRRMSLDTPGATLSQRNLMCLRALVNLAIALGAILDQSWPIVLENLQRADSIIAQSGTIASARDYRSGSQSSERGSSDNGPGQTSISSEIVAVEGAITRLFQSTVEYPNHAFLSLLGAMCDLIPDPKVSQNSNGSAPPLLLRTTSISGSLQQSTPQPRNAQFAIAKLGEIARLNILRLASSSKDSGWTMLMQKLLNISTSPIFDSTARLMAADVLGNIAVGVTVSTVSETVELREEVQIRSLHCLESQVQKMYENLEAEQDNANATDLDVHRSSLEALRAILEQCGDSLIAGWRIIFNIVETTFRSSRGIAADSDSASYEESLAERVSPRPISTRIARSAFACVQLICSDFLGSLKKSRVIILINIMSRFCAQKADLNISLTTLTLFWELSDFLQRDLAFAQFDINNIGAMRVEAQDAELIEAAEAGSFIAAWLVLQNRLASMTVDFRADVRNGAIHTVFRIVDNSGDNVSSEIWQFSMRAVIFQMVDININACKHSALIESGSLDDETKSLIATADNVLKGLASIIAAHLSAITNIPDFEDIWKIFLQHCASYMSLGSFELITYVFNALSQIISAAEDPERLPLEVRAETWKLWQRSVPPAAPSATFKTINNNEALESYVNTLKQLYRITRVHITDEQILQITQNLRDCVTASAATAYTFDVDVLTTLQTNILSCIDMLRTDLPNVPSYLVSCLAEFSTLPYARASETTTKSSTFIAFSKKAMELLRAAIHRHVSSAGIYHSGAIAKALAALARVISLKYTWKQQGKEPSMWRVAASAALAVIPPVLSSIKKLELSDNIRAQIWFEVVAIAGGIAEADRSALPLNDTLLADETFDLTALNDLRPHISRLAGYGVVTKPADMGWLGDNSIPEGIQHAYVANLFKVSIIHDGDDIVRSDPLEMLYSVRDGRTYDPSFNPRLRVCYSCLDELFSLVSDEGQMDASISQDITQSTSTKASSNTKLAEIAFPYLVARCSLPLRRYIADQPLRGLMPTPTSQRVELLHIVKKCAELQCTVGAEARMKGDMDGERQIKHWHVPVLKADRRHLEWLLPLINIAGGQARRDQEIADALQMVTDLAFRT